jgi:Sec-independent protein translocase protein TatA
MGYTSYQELEAGIKELKERNQELERAKNQSLKVQYSRSTQTDNLPSSSQSDQDLENTLTNLIASMQKLNQEIK